jgi:hypothetical protein
MKWGTLLEPVVAAEYAANNKHLRLRTKCGVWVNIDRPWQVASPDGFIIDPGTWSARPKPTGIWEGKTARYDDEWGEPGTDQIPIYYRCQVLWYLDTFGLRYADVSCLFTGSDYREYRVEWDKEDAEYLRYKGRQFLDRVERQERPDIDGSEATYRTIMKFHPEIDGTTVDVPDEIAGELIAAKQEFDFAAAEFTKAKAVLAEHMGTAKVAKAGEVKLADRRSKNGGDPYLQLAAIKAKPVKLAAMQ